MKFRTGLLAGGAVGYVLGARAGRERYEQIRRLAARLSAHPAALQLRDQAIALIDLGRRAVADGLSLGSRTLRRTAERRSA